ncbi:hypothetical protein [Candidatus Odyssella thessalonicensis]|uniref:hypothetical protein n=1 Tax=Candidatus Odyssella thessalonicensis TaxID=84647 RepID=UPI000225AC92|nr:hypothetical protein [Candidatus Odyssella thessalonicensis]
MSFKYIIIGCLLFFSSVSTSSEIENNELNLIKASNLTKEIEEDIADYINDIAPTREVEYHSPVEKWNHFEGWIGSQDGLAVVIVVPIRINLWPLCSVLEQYVKYFNLKHKNIIRFRGSGFVDAYLLPESQEKALVYSRTNNCDEPYESILFKNERVLQSFLEDVLKFRDQRNK